MLIAMPRNHLCLFNLIVGSYFRFLFMHAYQRLFEYVSFMLVNQIDLG